MGAFRAGRTIEIVVVTRPRFACVFANLFGAPPAEIVAAVVRLAAVPAKGLLAELTTHKPPIAQVIEIRTEVEVGRGALVAVIEGTDDLSAIADALSKLAKDEG